MSTIWVFENIENKHMLYCGEDCMKRFCTSLREHATKVINFEKKATVNTKTARIAPGCDSTLHLWKKIFKKVC